jgi:hypothetical protein
MSQFFEYHANYLIFQIQICLHAVLGNHRNVNKAHNQSHGPGKIIRASRIKQMGVNEVYDDVFLHVFDLHGLICFCQHARERTRLYSSWFVVVRISFNFSWRKE